MQPSRTFQHYTLTVLFIILKFIQLVSCQILWHTYEDFIGAENYSYFHISEPGNHRLEVVSIFGDADIYISDMTSYPNYIDYELKSTSCGIDIVDIPSSFQRPVAVSVYGHPNYMNTTFKLNIYYFNSNSEDEYEKYVSRYNPYENGEYNGNSKTLHTNKQYSTKSRKVQNDEDDGESPWMTLLIGILKIILDILF